MTVCAKGNRKTQKCLIFQAYGDALGKYTEFLTKDAIEKLYPSELSFDNAQSNGHNDCWSKYEWTDDTDQTLLIVKTCREGFDNADDLHKKFAKNLLAWYRNGFPQFGKKGCGIGDQIRWALNDERYGSEPLTVTKGIWEEQEYEIRENGALMRTGIIGCLFNSNDQIAEIATHFTLVTHYDPCCVTVSIFQSLLVRALLDRKTSNVLKIIKTVLENTKKYVSTDSHCYLSSLLEPVINGDYDPQNIEIDHPYYRGTIDCSLPIAVWGLLQVTNKSYTSIINVIAKFGGDADTNCAICGILLGSFFGAGDLPSDYRKLNIKMISEIIYGSRQPNI